MRHSTHSGSSTNKTGRKTFCFFFKIFVVIRPDRDEYVKIVWDNIQGGERGAQGRNFKKAQKRGSEAYMSYDYNSIMHFANTEFAKEDGLITIGKGRYQNTKKGEKMHAYLV